MKKAGWTREQINHQAGLGEQPGLRAQSWSGGVGSEPRGMSRVGLDGVILTRIVIHQVLQALEGEPRGNVIPVVWQTEDSVMLHLPVSHRERIKTCREWRTGHHPRATS